MTTGRAAQRPRWLFHLLVALPAGVVLWAASSPAVALFPAAIGVLGVLVGALGWAVRLAVVVLRTRRASPWFSLAPLAGVVVLGLLVAGVPLQARWALDRADFASAAEAVVAGAPLDDVRRVGTVDVSLVDRLPGGGLAFYDRHAGLFDDAGFAWLPQGPTEQVRSAFVSVRLHHLGGDWYTFSASW